MLQIKRIYSRISHRPQKSFDTINHEILINKLECYRIRGAASEGVRSWENPNTLV